MLRFQGVRRAACAAALVFAGSGPTAALAQDGAAPSSEAPNREGDYGGVTPGDASGAPKAARGAPVARWVGFQRLSDGRSRVFVQLATDVPVEQTVDGDKLLVTLVGARIASPNELRRLDTRFFDTAVREIVAKRVARRRATGNRPGHPAGLQLAIEFKNPANAAPAPSRVTSEPDGYHYVYLEFGPGEAMSSPQASR